MDLKAILTLVAVCALSIAALGMVAVTWSMIIDDHRRRQREDREEREREQDRQAERLLLR